MYELIELMVPDYRIAWISWRNKKLLDCQQKSSKRNKKTEEDTPRYVRWTRESGINNYRLPSAQELCCFKLEAFSHVNISSFVPQLHSHT